MSYLTISAERFTAAYNSYLFIPGVSKKVELEYLSWSNANKLLNQFFPEIVVEFERDENNSFGHKIENTFKKEAKEDIVKLLNEKKELLLSVTDWKVKAKLEEELNTLLNTLLYANRGWYVLAQLIDRETGLKTPSLFFPVMDNKNNAIINPDARDINDAKARAGVKAIALYTGIGLRLYTREDIAPKGLIENSPKWKGIQYIISTSSALGREVDSSVVHLGRSLVDLKKIADDLYNEANPE